MKIQLLKLYDDKNIPIWQGYISDENILDIMTVTLPSILYEYVIQRKMEIRIVTKSIESSQGQ